MLRFSLINYENENGWGANRHCDTLIINGRVLDPETGLNEITNVAIYNGSITYVGDSTPNADRVIDAVGKTVSPGFIDLHSHAQTIPALQRQVMDGVTTALELESGVGDIKTAMHDAEIEGRPTNYGYSASWAQARMGVMDGYTPPGGFLDFATHMGTRGWRTPGSVVEIDRIMGRIEDQISLGALGAGVLVGYAPQTGRQEYLRLARTAARLGVPTFTHSRHKNPDEPGSALEGAAEVVAAAAGTGAHMHLCHINSTSLRSIDEVGELVVGARSLGVSISTEAYPYGAGMTGISQPQLHPKNLERLGIRPSDLVVVATGERPVDARRLLEISEESPGELIIAHYLNENIEADLAVIRKAMLLPDTAIASDAISYTTSDGRVIEGHRALPDGALSHPRTAGTFSKFFKWMVQSTEMLTLTEAVRRCTLIPAQILEGASSAMRRKGRIQVGCDADLVVFDPAEISDRSTYEEPTLASTGISHVLVNGYSVVFDGCLVRDAMPGKPISTKN